MTKHRMKAVAIAAASMAVLAVSAMVPATAAPGNNGTVKVDNIDLDNQPNANEPHVGCVFRIEWYGFDPSVTSHVTFEAQPPTGTRLLLEDDVTLSSNATPGGSPAAFDGEEYYTLDFNDGDFFHPKQGYHVYLTINTPTSNGADVKHKVFWVQGCDVPPPPV